MTVNVGVMQLPVTEDPDPVRTYLNGTHPSGGLWTALTRASNHDHSGGLNGVQLTATSIPDGSITTAKLDPAVLLPYALVDGSKPFTGTVTMNNDLLVRDTLSFGAKPGGLADATLARVTPGQLRVGGAAHTWLTARATGSASSAWFGQAVPAPTGAGRVDIAANLAFDGTNWIAEDTTAPGGVVGLNGAVDPASPMFAIYDAPPGANPRTLAGRLTLARNGWLTLPTGGLLVNTLGAETGTHAGATTAWQNSRARISETGFETLSLLGNNAAGSNLNFFHLIGSNIWRGAVLTSRLQDATPGSQRAYFEVQLPGVGNVEPATVYGAYTTQHVWNTNSAPAMGLYGHTLGIFGTDAVLQTAYGQGVWTQVRSAGIYNGGSNITVGSDSNVMLVPLNGAAGGYVHGSVNDTQFLGHPGIRWSNLYIRRIDADSDIVAQGYIKAGGNGIVRAGADAGAYCDYMYSGIFGTWPANFQIKNNSGFQFMPGGVNFFVIENAANGFYPNAENTVSCGRSGNRWSAVWAGNGSIQTCLTTEKRDFRALDPEDALLAILRTPIQKYRAARPELPAAMASDDGRLYDFDFVGFRAEAVDPLFLLDGDQHVSPQHTASIAVSGIQALYTRLAKLEARLKEIGK